MKVAESWCFSNWIRFQTFKNRLWHLFYPEKDFSCRWQHSWCFAWKGDLGKDAQRNRQSQHKKAGDTYTAEGNGKMKRDNPKTQFRSIPKSSERHSSSRKEFSFGQMYGDIFPNTLLGFGFGTIWKLRQHFRCVRRSFMAIPLGERNVIVRLPLSIWSISSWHGECIWRKLIMSLWVSNCKPWVRQLSLWRRAKGRTWWRTESCSLEPCLFLGRWKVVLVLCSSMWMICLSWQNTRVMSRPNLIWLGPMRKAAIFFWRFQQRL